MCKKERKIDWGGGGGGGHRERERERKKQTGKEKTEPHLLL